MFCLYSSVGEFLLALIFSINSVFLRCQNPFYSQSLTSPYLDNDLSACGLFFKYQNYHCNITACHSVFQTYYWATNHLPITTTTSRMSRKIELRVSINHLLVSHNHSV